METPLQLRQSMLASSKRHPFKIKVKVGADANGRPLAQVELDRPNGIFDATSAEKCGQIPVDRAEDHLGSL